MLGLNYRTCRNIWAVIRRWAKGLSQYLARQWTSWASLAIENVLSTSPNALLRHECLQSCSCVVVYMTHATPTECYLLTFLRYFYLLTVFVTLYQCKICAFPWLTIYKIIMVLYKYFGMQALILQTIFWNNVCGPGCKNNSIFIVNVNWIVCL